METTFKKIASIQPLVLIIIIILSACTQNGGKGIKTTIKGSFPALKGKKITLSEFDISNSLPVDTTIIAEDGSFKFKFRRANPGFFLVKVDNRNFLTLILDREQKIFISSDQKNIRKSYTVEGSPDSELYRDFEMFLEVNRDKVDSLSRSYNDNMRSSAFHSLKLELDKTYQVIFNNQHLYSTQFIKNHCGSLASLLVLNRRFGERKILTEDKDFAYYVMVDSCLTVKYPENKHLADLKKRMQKWNDERRIIEMVEKRLTPGNKVPDIELQDQSGRPVKLHSLAGKPVILYFWASWDEESRKANKILKALIDKQASTKPSVYAVGLESYKELWINAIDNDKIQDWIHVSDLLNINSSAKSLFNIPDELPYFFYLDNDMIIRYKGNDFVALTTDFNRHKQ